MRYPRMAAMRRARAWCWPAPLGRGLPVRASYGPSPSQTNGAML